MFHMISRTVPLIGRTKKCWISKIKYNFSQQNKVKFSFKRRDGSLQ